MLKLCLLLINFYQTFLSFDTGVLRLLNPLGVCKFKERCSDYTKRMMIEFGVVKGVWLGLKRLGRCF